MGEVRVRNLDESVILEFKERARRHGESLEGELRKLLTAEAMRPRREWAAKLAALREAIGNECGILPDSTSIIRAERDSQ